MTAGERRRSVLVLGRSQLLLDEIVTALREAGYTALATSDFSGGLTGRLDVRELDLIVFGRQVPPDREAGLKEEIRAASPRVIFLEGVAGIPGLVVNQVRGAFADGRQDPAHAPAYAPGRRVIQLPLAEPADVTVTLWWRVPSTPPHLKSGSLVLCHGPFASGDHAIPVPGHIFTQSRLAFATVRVDAAIYTLTLTADR